MSELDHELQMLFQQKHTLLINIDKIDDRIIEIKEEKLKRNNNKEVDIVFFDDD